MIQLIMLVFCLSYFSGLLLYMLMGFTRDKNADEEEDFIKYFEMEEKADWDIMIAMMYAAFTTLSTVGLGDYHPRSNGERIITALYMLFGAMITSFIMQVLTDVIKQIRFVGKDYD